MSVTREPQGPSSTSTPAAKGAPGASSAATGGASSSAVQLKQSLRGKGYDAQAATLAPQAEGATPKRVSFPGFTLPGGNASSGDTTKAASASSAAVPAPAPAAEKKGADAPAKKEPEPAAADDDGEAVIGDLDLFSGPSQKALPVVATLTTSSSIAHGGKVDAGNWGNTNYEVSAQGLEAEKQADKITVKADVHTDFLWNVAGPGDSDVTSATSSLVTADNAKAIHDDLMPSAADPQKSMRKHYWSKALVERHEVFHAKDFDQHVKTTGIEGARKEIAGEEAYDVDRAQSLVRIAAEHLKEGIQHFYFGSKDPSVPHDARAREIPTYRDGAPHYKALAEGALAQGEKLKKEAAPTAAAPPQAAQQQQRAAAPAAAQKNGADG